MLKAGTSPQTTGCSGVPVGGSPGRLHPSYLRDQSGTAVTLDFQSQAHDQYPNAASNRASKEPHDARNVQPEACSTASSLSDPTGAHRAPATSQHGMQDGQHYRGNMASARNCSLHDLPPEVVMNILASLSLQSRLLAAQASQWLHSAVMQPAFWPTHPGSLQTPASSVSHQKGPASEKFLSAAGRPIAALDNTMAHRQPADTPVGNLGSSNEGKHRPTSVTARLSTPPPSACPDQTAGGAISDCLGSHADSESRAAGWRGSLNIADGNCESIGDGCNQHLTGWQQQQQQQQQQQHASGKFIDARPVHAEDGRDQHKEAQGSLLGFAGEQRGLTVLVAVVDPVTGQKGYAKQASAHGLEPRCGSLHPLSSCPVERQLQVTVGTHGG